MKSTLAAILILSSFSSFASSYICKSKMLTRISSTKYLQMTPSTRFGIKGKQKIGDLQDVVIHQLPDVGVKYRMTAVFDCESDLCTMKGTLTEDLIGSQNVSDISITGNGEQFFELNLDQAIKISCKQK